MIFSKDLSDKIVKISEEISFKVGYPTVKQKFELDRAISFGIDKPFPVKDGQIDWESISPEESNKAAAAENYRKALYLKYTIKGWTGFTEEAIIENNELNEAQWQELCYSQEFVNTLYSAIDEKLRWNLTDKKKFISTEGLNTKAE